MAAAVELFPITGRKGTGVDFFGPSSGFGGGSLLQDASIAARHTVARRKRAEAVFISRGPYYVLATGEYPY